MYREALGLVRELRDGWWIARCLHFLGLVAARRRDARRAATLFGASDARLLAIGGRLVPQEEADYRELAAERLDAAGDAAFERAHAAGGALPLSAAIRLALDAEAELPA